MGHGQKNILKKAADFITKDTSNKNESKKLIVVIRIILLSILVYFTANLIFCSTIFSGGIVYLLYIAFLIIFTGIFALSYLVDTIYTLWLFNMSIITWICAIIHFFGWTVGVQHFLLVLLILYFFSSYKQYTGKICYAVAMCALKIILFLTYNGKASVLHLSTMEINMLQILNSIAVCWCISVVGFIFSNDTQELEEKLVVYNSQLEQQANTDTLTGLFNRRRAIEYLNYIVKNQNNNAGFSLCICDIDFFKKVNDNYGHDFGDEVLKKISEIFKEEVNGKNLVARWGGEEFLLLFPGCNGDDAYIKLERLRNRIKETKIKKNGLEIGITMTFGLAEYDFKNGLEATIKEADDKLYMGKNKGRDIIIY